MKPKSLAVSRPGLPTVSVVVPTYQRAAQLEVCVCALLADPATTEVVVAIDGSGDGSYELATRLGAKDSRVVVFEQAHTGTQAARNAAVQRATGEVVFLVDDDVVLLHLWGGNVSLRRVDFLSIEVETWNVEHEDQLFGIRCHQAGLRGVFDCELYAEHRYMRKANSFLSSARARGVAKWQLHTLFPEFLGELDTNWASAGLPGPV